MTKRKKLDREISEQVNKISQLAVTWSLIVKDTNECAATDRIIEDIIEEAKKLNKLQEKRFKVMSGE